MLHVLKSQIAHRCTVENEGRAIFLRISGLLDVEHELVSL